MTRMLQNRSDSQNKGISKPQIELWKRYRTVVKNFIIALKCSIECKNDPLLNFFLRFPLTM